MTEQSDARTKSETPIKRLDVAKEVGRMAALATWKAIKIGVLAILPVTAFLGAVLFALTLTPEPATLNAWIHAGVDAVPDVVWTTLTWVGRIIGLLLWAKIIQGVWFIARERAQERENDA